MKKKIKIIDLLCLIAVGEKVPKKIKHHWVYEYKYDELRNEFHYMDCENKRFDEEWFIFSMLNDEVEILDSEDEFEDIDRLPINELYLTESQQSHIVDTINGLIKNQRLLINKINERNDKND